MSYPQIDALNDSVRRQALQWQDLNTQLQRAREQADAEEQASLQREIDTLEANRSMLAVQKQIVEQQAALVRSSDQQGKDVRDTKNLTIAVLILTALAVIVAILALLPV